MSIQETIEKVWRTTPWRGIIGVMIILLAFAFLFVLIFVKIPKENENIITLSAGIVLAMAGSVTNYYFGSSKDKSDAEKNTQVNTLLQAQPPQP